MRRAPLILLAASVGAFAADEPVPEVLRALENLAAPKARAGREQPPARVRDHRFRLAPGSRMPNRRRLSRAAHAEPGGVLAVRWSPSDPHLLIAVALREGKRRLLLLDDQGGRTVELESRSGDQLVGGFTRDGKKLFYGVVEGGAVSLRQVGVDATRKVTEVKPGAIAPQNPFLAGPPAAPARSGPGPGAADDARSAGNPAAAPPAQAAPARQAPVALEGALQGLAAVVGVADGRRCWCRRAAPATRRSGVVRPRERSRRALTSTRDGALPPCRAGARTAGRCTS